MIKLKELLAEGKAKPSFIKKAQAILQKELGGNIEVKDSNLIFELREREYYKKPSAIRKEIKNKAKARNHWKKIKLMEEDSRKRGRKF